MPRPEITGRKLRTHRRATAASRDEGQGEEDLGHEGGGGEQGGGNYSEPGALADPYLNANQVKHRYGDCSDMWLHRRLHDDSGFPPPDLVVNGRRFWRLSSLVRWERQRAAV